MDNQSNHYIKNHETHVPKTPQMNDRDFINDLLETEKHLTSAYSIALNEASNESFYRDLATIFKETQDCHRSLYNNMFKNGWYAFEAAQDNTVEQTYQKFSGYMNQLPYLQ